MSTLFTKIIIGEIPSYKIAENDEFYAFLDISPLTIGHTLVVPKVEVDYIFDVDDDLLGRMMVFSKKVAKAMALVVTCNRVGVVVMGLEVPHAHIHLIPINEMADMSFSNSKLELSKEEFNEVAENISITFNSLT